MHSNLESILSKIVSDSILHARWLNTFSYLEFIGFRKIIKSQTSNFITGETLEHAIEEGRHALLMKKLSIKFGGKSFDSYSAETMLCSDQAARYFHDLDQACDLAFSQITSPMEQSHLVYLCLTWLVELRAISIYHLYQRIAMNAGIQLPLSGLLAEEDHHLKAVESKLQILMPRFENKIRELQQLENQLYEDFLFAVVKEIGVSADAVSLHG